MKSKTKLIAAAISAVLMFSVVGGGVSSIISNYGKGEIVQAAEKTRSQIIKIIKNRYPKCAILKLKKDYDDGHYHWEAKIRNGSYIIELEISSNGVIYDVDYDD